MKKCVILDLDGSIANDSLRAKDLKDKLISWRSYFLRSGEDTVIRETLEFLRTIPDEIDIIVSTGRPQFTKKVTKKWIEDHLEGIKIKDYLMRPNHSFIKNERLKEQNLDIILKKGYEVYVAIEDNPRAIEMYKRRKINVREVKI